MFSSNTTQESDGGYQISRSLRFNSADGTSLDRTPSSATNRQTFTISFWAKNPSTAGAITTFYGAGSDTNNNETVIGYWDGLYVQNVLAGAQWRIRTAAVYRDPSAWYHFIFAFDLSNGTQANRLKIYVNGVESSYSAADGNPLPSTANSMVNSNVIQYIGRRAYSATGQTTNAYLTEFYLIDGQALTPSSFGETNAQTGVWQPKAYSGSYGTNGFYLNFSDNSNTTAATLGKDYSPNGNNWTPNNFSVAAGAGNDSLVDTPTPYGSDTGAGGNVRGNYCTLNPLARGIGGSGITLSNGNLDGVTPSDAILSVLGTIGVSSGKWYWEITPTADGSVSMVGIGSPTANLNTYPGGGGGQSWGYYGSGEKYFNNVNSAYGSAYGNLDVIGVALDMDAGTVAFYKNGVSQGTAFTGLTGTILPMMGDGGTVAAVAWNSNFGQRPFAYTAPSGFKALCTQNLPTPTIGATTATQAGKYFNAVTYTGTQTTQSVTGVGFQPDFVWNKDRTAAWTHVLTDAVRGAGKSLFSQSTEIEVTNDSNGYVSAFNSDGFTLAGGLRVNASGDAIVAWNWKANGSGVTNTAGSITSTVSANTTSGFSVVTWTGTGANATIGHGLGVAPRMIIVKQRNGVNIWPVYNEDIGNTQYLRLNGNNPAGTFNVWQNTSPTSSVFYVSTDSTVNANAGTYVAYCFAEILGYSRIRTYVGNGSTDGPFVFTGFRPKFLLIKVVASNISWSIEDGTRSPSNVVSNILYPDLSNAEDVGPVVDFLSNGFKIRTISGTYNDNGSTYIFMALAESPFKYSLAR